MKLNRPDSRIRFKRGAAIVDLDGTLTWNGGRDPYDWSRVKHDLPNSNVIAVVQALRDSGLKLIFVSGRMDVARCRTDSLCWLRKHVDAGIQSDQLHMRANKDLRPDEVVKRELYEQHIEPEYSVRVVLDDRNKVVQMWRSLGLTCLQVADAPF